MDVALSAPGKNRAGQLFGRVSPALVLNLSACLVDPR